MRRRWWTGIVMLAILAVATTSAPRASHAGIDPELRAGFYTDGDAFAVGAGLLANMGSSGWFFNPNLDFAMGDGPDLVVLSGDFHYDFTTLGTASVWAGGGPALMFADRGSDTDTMAGLNLLMGIGTTGGTARPFGQVRATLADDSQVALTAGIRF